MHTDTKFSLKRTEGIADYFIGTMYDDNQDARYNYDENIKLKSLVVDLALSGQLPLKISFKIRSGPLDFPVFKDFIIT
jgi:hypothetical protein